MATPDDDAVNGVNNNPTATKKQTRSDSEIYDFIAAKSESEQLFYTDGLLVGAGAAGVGVAHALLRGGLDPSKFVMLEKGPGVGCSFRQWHTTTRFISPSWPAYPFGIQDLNAVVPDTSVNGQSGQHPTGSEYLERMVKGTNLQIFFNHAVTSIERVTQGCFIVETDRGNVFIANYVVWCGGEWVSPRLFLDDALFARDATVHYKHANLDTLLDSRRSKDDPIVLVGGGEAGADLGVALAQRGAKVLIVESSSEGDENEASLDPSRRLAPVTQERLSMVGDKIELRMATTCTSAKRNGDTVTVTLESTTTGGDDDKTTTSVNTGANVVLCTGFDPSSNPLVKDLFTWRDGLPHVTPEHDESTITRNLFLAGPALRHTLTCKDDDESENTTNNKNEEEDSSKNIIFCFVYKYRTRFAVVARTIIQRFVEDQQLMKQNIEDDFDDEEEAESLLEAFLSQEQLDEILAKCDKMQSFYRSKGMMLTDLSCAQLACGMTANDAPTYNYEGCGCEPAECETC